MRYLLINIRSPVNTIFELNGKKKSLWGRAEVLKMNILPKLSFLFSSIPLQFPQHWLKEVNSLFSGFLWRNKKPRMNHKKLTRYRYRGGLGVPDIYLYYLPYNARYPLSWGYKNGGTIGSWKWLEEKIVLAHNSVTLPALWFYPRAKLKMENLFNLILL